MAEFACDEFLEIFVLEQREDLLHFLDELRFEVMQVELHPREFVALDAEQHHREILVDGDGFLIEGD
jgi:hypothetical protein